MGGAGGSAGGGGVRVSRSIVHFGRRGLNSVRASGMLLDFAALGE